MKIRAILIDADGVVLRPRDKYFTERLSEDFGVPLEKSLPFFEREYKDVVRGQKDLAEEISRYAQSWNWRKTTEDLLNYWFSHENKIDSEVLGLVDSLRNDGYKVYLASDHSIYRADDLMKKVGLEKHFDGAFFSAYVGYTKEEKGFYETVLDDLKLQPEEMLFIDDETQNIETAKGAGIKGHLFGDVRSLTALILGMSAQVKESWREHPPNSA